MDSNNENTEAANPVASTRPEDATSVVPLEEEKKDAVSTVPSSNIAPSDQVAELREDASVPPGSAVIDLTADVQRLHLRGARPCGAEKRRRKKQKALSKPGPSPVAGCSSGSVERRTEGLPIDEHGRPMVLTLEMAKTWPGPGECSTSSKQGSTSPKKGSKSSKRLRSSETPPSTSGATKKRCTIMQPRNYKEAAESNLRVAVIPDGYPEPKLSKEQIEAVQGSILDALFKLPREVFTPRFEDSREADGALVMTCADQETKSWLAGVVPTLKVWEGAKLSLVEKSALPKLTRALVWVPGLMEDSKRILQMMARQNPGLSTDRWRLFSREERRPHGTLLIVGLDAASIEVLRACQLRPYIGLTRAEVTLPGKTSTRKEAGQ